ncbi:MAG: isochorismatase family protein [Candidatus Bathyarchaeota archaeon]|nr:isochorismatase family protein [Candidatus Bathyarchaeota archaeon]
MKKKIRLNKTDALIVIDIQNDFLSGGSLPVPSGEEVIRVLNDYIEVFKKARGNIFATRDWHPANHVSFRENGGIWPAHCIRETKGAQFHPKLSLPKNVIVISKATEPVEEAYSGFDNTNLLKELKKKKVIRVFIGGLATDYCVKNTVLDALKFGFETSLLIDASRGIDSTPGDVQRAIDLMQNNGTKKIEFNSF